ncbi:DUF2313 domain-containing protein [Salmonella enterica]|nr:DUF2313 domain-containing protein [Salmonella enterica]ELI0533006.1 DUF2313 domain-containing protein [Salmonella enterica]
MQHSDLLAALLPPVSYPPQAPRLRAELNAEGRMFDALYSGVKSVTGAVTPFYAESLLPDWERVLGVTAETQASYQQRLSRVLAKLAETGGLSIPYFTRLAMSMGYRITIDEPEPFRAGVGRAGDRIYTPDIIFMWRVNVFTTLLQNYRFRAGQSAAGERLSWFADAVIESVFNDLKPAHTYCYFTYQEAQ